MITTLGPTVIRGRSAHRHHSRRKAQAGHRVSAVGGVNARMMTAYHRGVPVRRSLPAPAKAALGGVVGLAFLGAVEAALWAVDVPDSGLYKGDPATLWFLRPGLDRVVTGPDGSFRVRTNSLGLRGQAPPETGPWTLILGCSTTFGWGVEDEVAWPAQLGGLLMEPVVNGGVPGWSTEQAVRGAAQWLSLGPTRVVLAYGVRDAWPAARSDRQARPTPRLLRTHLGRLLVSLRDGAPVPGRAATGDSHRVAPQDFADNTREIISLAGDAEVSLLWFPQREERVAWREALATVGPVLWPKLPASDFFEDDPVHLNPQGNTALAQWLAAAW
jgi:hypothetical protein